MKCSMEHNKQISLRNEEVNETEVGAEKKKKKKNLRTWKKLIEQAP